MLPPPPASRAATRCVLAGRVIAMLEAEPRRVPFVLGGCGSGRTTTLRHVQNHYGTAACQYIDIERTATTPERFFQAVVSHSPFAAAMPGRVPATPREAFSLLLTFLASAQTSGGQPAMFLLDETLELRTFESFPGLRQTVQELLARLATTRNRFVLASRYEVRVARLLRGGQHPCVPLSTVGLTSREIGDLLRMDTSGAGQTGGTPADEANLRDLAAVVQLLSDGRPAYADAIAIAMRTMRANGGGDPVSALSALLCSGGQLARRCEHSYAIRLNRARGYGALKAILDILSDEEPLTLSEVSQRLRRTPGSTRDYLSWLEDVDLVGSRDKRYYVRDPILRLWIRLYCRPVPPSDDAVARHVQHYALQRLAARSGDRAGGSDPHLSHLRSGSDPVRSEVQPTIGMSRSRG
jgi:hypothetical protein